VHWLLEGPRGRRLLWQLVEGRLRESGRPVPRGADPDGVRSAVRGLGRDTASEAELLQAFADSVCWARYWQEPDDLDTLLADLVEDLLVVAERVQPPLWWSSPVDLDDQVLVTWEGPAPGLDGAADKLRLWREAAMVDEHRARAERPSDRGAPWSGAWWSAPVMSGLASTSRPRPGVALVEDDQGWDGAALTPVAVTRPVRVLEVHSPADWTRLVARYPLDVSASRRHDWWRATGAREPLLLPDYSAAAEDWDGIHVSPRGYLTTATRALAVNAGSTVLAGWNPDQTWWLTDCLQVAGPSERRPVTR
jgi:hypothetical protein